MADATGWDRVRTFRYVAIVGAICAVGLLVGYGVGLHGALPLPVDRNGVPLGRDFLNTWFYGRAFFQSDPGRFYDRTLYMHTVQSLFPQDAADRLWSYPPPFLLFAAPFGHLPYIVALAAWSVCGLAALGLAVRRNESVWLSAAILTSPVVVYSLIAGQVSLLAGAVLLTVFAQLDRRPIVAGLLLSLLVIKPQSAVLIPVLLIASRRWTVLISAAAGTFLIVAASVASNGVETWTQFIEVGLPTQIAEMKNTIEILAPISASITTAAVCAGLPAAAVTFVQSAAGLLAVLLVAWVGWSRKRAGVSTDYEGLVVLTCSIFATPYFLIHDLVAFSAAALVVAYREGLIRNRFALLALLYAPLMQSGLTRVHLYILPLLALGFAIWLVLRHVPGRDGDRFAIPDQWCVDAGSG